MQKLKNLQQFLCYVLGYRPDEFGLLPDSEGYIKIKELLKALSEEEGYKYVRIHDINEILLNVKNPEIEINDNTIRAVCRDNLPKLSLAKNTPKLLYTCIRQKSHLHILEKGLIAQENSYIILSNDINLSQRIGKRKDTEPVTLTVNVSQAIEKNVVFYQMGELLYLAESLPLGCFSLPPFKKIKVETKKEDKVKIDKNIGSFIVGIANLKNQIKGKGKKKITWKEDRKKLRKLYQEE